MVTTLLLINLASLGFIAYGSREMDRPWWVTSHHSGH